MKILITGTRGLAQELAFIYADHDVNTVSLSTGHNIHQIDKWGSDFLDYDLVFNCAYSERGQQLVLEYFYHHWQYDATKSVITIGSKIITQPGADLTLANNYWPYRVHKQTLQAMHDSMWPTAQCDLKIVNPGAFNSGMVSHLDIPKLDLCELAIRIKKYTEDPVIKRVDLWL
jgi:hypothetical protein